MLRVSSILALAACVSLTSTACGRRRGTGTGIQTDGGGDTGTSMPEMGTFTDLGIDFGAVVDMTVATDLGVDMSTISAACPPYAHVSGDCEAPADGDIAIDSSNRLFVYHLGVWQGVCDDIFTTTTASVACRQLGYESGTYMTTSGPSDVFWLDSVSCLGDEASLVDCSHDEWGSEDCGTTEWVALTCAL